MLRFIAANTGQRIYKDKLRLVLKLGDDAPRKLAQLCFRPYSPDFYITLPYLKVSHYHCGLIEQAAGSSLTTDVTKENVNTSRVRVKLSYHESGLVLIKEQAADDRRLAALQVSPIAALSGQHIFTLELEGLHEFAEAKERELMLQSTVAISATDSAYRAKVTGFAGYSYESISGKYEAEDGTLLKPTHHVTFVRPRLPGPLFLGLYLFVGDSLNVGEPEPGEVATLGYQTGEVVRGIYVWARRAKPDLPAASSVEMREEERKMPERQVRDTAHVGGVWTSLARLRNIVHYGHAALRRPTKAKPKQREIVVRYFILHGIVTTLGQVKEAVEIITALQPSLKLVVASYADDFALWKRFRDDAAHVVDRTHRVSLSTQNNAVINMDQYGYDTDVLKYDEPTDTACTGVNDSLVLGEAVRKVEELTVLLAEAIRKGYRDGTIPPPPRIAAAQQTT